MTRWAIIYNPAAGSFRERRLEAIERVLTGQGITTVAIPTARPGHATGIAHSLRGVDCVAVYGGDGTLNEVLNGLAGRGIPLAALPGGTANVMAHELGLPRDPVRAARALLRGRPLPVRPGRVEGRLFLLMVGFGFDAEVVRRVPLGLKGWLGKAAYLWSGAKVLASPLPALRAAGNGGAERRIAWVVAARAAHYGGRFRIHPRAGLLREKLGVALVGRAGLVPFLTVNLGLGIPWEGPRVWLEDHARLRVESAAPFPVQVDGDYLGEGKAFHVELAEETIPLCFPGRPPSPPKAGADSS